MRRLVPALSLAISIAACRPATPAVDFAAEEQAIRTQVAVFNAAIRDYNDSAAVSIYAPDAVLLPPNQGRMAGTELITQYFSSLEPLKAQMAVTPTAIVVAGSGDLAVEEGTWTMSLPSPDGSIYQDNGKYLVAWTKKNGTWLVQYDTWNSSNAPPSASVSSAPTK